MKCVWRRIHPLALAFSHPGLDADLRFQARLTFNCGEFATIKIGKGEEWIRAVRGKGGGLRRNDSGPARMDKDRRQEGIAIRGNRHRTARHPAGCRNRARASGRGRLGRSLTTKNQNFQPSRRIKPIRLMHAIPNSRQTSGMKCVRFGFCFSAAGVS